MSRPMRNALTVAAAATVGAVATVAAQELPDHSAFTGVLQAHVQGDLVDYATLAADPVGLAAYLGELAQTDAAVLAAAPRDARLAFWINAYNACALWLVIDHYPIKRAGFPASLVRSLQGVPANSIRQIPDTWSREFCDVAGKARSLDEIEHEIIRPMGDPRIHFAVNCASRSCPVLAPEAYTAQRLAAQLDAAVQRFLASPRHYRLERGDHPALHLNKVLDWYKDDFGGTDGVVEFLLRHVAPEDAEYIRTHSPIVEFSDYDWTLNDTAVFGRGSGS